MKKLVMILTLLLVCIGPAFGSIEFVDSASPGGWQYDGVNTFTFTQPITVSDVDNSGADTLNGMFVHLPDLVVSGYNVLNPGIAAANIRPQGAIQIWDTVDQSGTMLMQAGFIDPMGSFFAYFAAGNVYAPSTSDLTVSAVNNTIGSGVLDSMDIGTLLGFILTLNHDDNFTDFMYQTPAVSAAGGFSGQINIVPEPMTLALLGLGGLTLLRRRR